MYGKTLKAKGMLRKSYTGDGKGKLVAEPKGYQKPMAKLGNDEMSADVVMAQGSGEYSKERMKGCRNHSSMKRVLKKAGY